MTRYREVCGIVTFPAHVKAKGPIGRHDRLAYDVLVVLPGHVGRGRSRKDVEGAATAHGPERDGRRRIELQLQWIGIIPKDPNVT